MQKLKNIIVTGSNKGVGFGIIENLAQKQGWNIIMACRSIQLAEKSKDQLLGKFPNAHIHTQKLDVTNEQSIKEFQNLIKQKYKQIDVLVNNAGVAPKDHAFDDDAFKFTFQTNFYGTIQLSESLLPLISNHGKIIFVGSNIGKIKGRIQNQDLYKRLTNQNITKKQLVEIMEEFRNGVNKNICSQLGWPKSKSIYGASKVGINLYAKILSKHQDVIKRGIQVYALCPGYVNTDMTSHKGHLTIQQGALTPVFLIQLPFQVNPAYQGHFFFRSALSSLY